MNITNNLTVPSYNDMLHETQQLVNPDIYIYSSINNRIFFFSLILLIIQIYYMIKFKSKKIAVTYLFNVFIFVLSLNGILHFIENEIILLLGLLILSLTTGGSLILLIPTFMDDIEKFIDKISGGLHDK